MGPSEFKLELVFNGTMTCDVMIENREEPR